MVFPINFAMGVVVGAAVTYLYKSDTAKEKLAATGEKIKQGVKSGTGRVAGLFKKSPKAEAEAEEVVTTEEIRREEPAPQNA